MKNVGLFMRFLCCLLFLIVPITSHAALTVDFGAQLCGPDSMWVDGVCTTITRGKCNDGYYQIYAEPATFSGTSAGNSCTGAYAPATFSDWFYIMYSGTLVSFGATLCGAGQYFVNGECKSYAQGECPTGLYQVTAASEMFLPTNLGACNDGYTAYNITTNCTDGIANNGTCALLCGSGLKYTGVGTCAPLCTTGVTTLNTSVGRSWLLYATRQTTPSLVVKTDAGICYANLVPGTATDAINVQTETNDIYHITD